MVMRSARIHKLLCLAAAGLLLAGCKSQATKLSESMHLLDLQNQLWAKCLGECRKGQPDLNDLGQLYTFLGERTRLRMKEDYPKSNKAEAVKLIAELGDEYRQNVVAKLRPTMTSVELQPGVTKEDICNAFIAMNDKYQKLVDLTK